MFISLMTGQTETTEIKMNMRNIITARSGNGANLLI